MHAVLLLALVSQATGATPAPQAVRATPVPTSVEVGALVPDLTLPRIWPLAASETSSSPGTGGEARPAFTGLASLRGKRVLLIQFASW